MRALDLPEIIAEAWRAHPVIQEFEAHQALAWEYRENYDAMAPLLRARLDESRGMTPADYDAAMGVASRARHALAKVFEEVDVLLTLSAPGAAPQGIGLDRRRPLQPAMDADGRALRQCSRAHRGRRIAGRRAGDRAIWRRCRRHWRRRGLSRRRLSGNEARSPDERSDIREMSSTDPGYRCAHPGYDGEMSYFAPIRPSVPACSRLMFSLCFQNSSSVSTTNSEASAGWPNHHRNSGVTKAATSAESDE